MAPAIPPQWFYRNSTVAPIKPFLNTSFSNFAQVLAVTSQSEISSQTLMSTVSSQTLTPVLNGTQSNSTFSSSGKGGYNKATVIAGSVIGGTLLILTILIWIRFCVAFRGTIPDGTSQVSYDSTWNQYDITRPTRMPAHARRNERKSNSNIHMDNDEQGGIRLASRTPSKSNSEHEIPPLNPPNPINPTNTRRRSSLSILAAKIKTLSDNLRRRPFRPPRRPPSSSETSTQVLQPPKQNDPVKNPLTGKNEPQIPSLNNRSGLKVSPILLLRLPRPNSTRQRKPPHPNSLELHPFFDGAFDYNIQAPSSSEQQRQSASTPSPRSMPSPNPISVPPKPNISSLRTRDRIRQRQSSSLLPITDTRPNRNNNSNDADDESSIYSRHPSGSPFFDPFDPKHDPPTRPSYREEAIDPAVKPIVDSNVGFRYENSVNSDVEDRGENGESDGDWDAGIEREEKVN